MDNRQGDDKGPNIQDVRLCLEQAFPGVDFKISHGISTFQAVGTFDEYEMRVILSGTRKEGRPFHIRLMQRAGRVRRMIVDVTTTDPAEAEAAIKSARSHIMGMVVALRGALNPKVVREKDGLESLMMDGFDRD